MSIRLLSIYRLRLRRKRLLWRAFRKRRQLQSVTNRMQGLRAQPILLFSTMRNERVRLPYFLDYYRKLGVDQFLIIDNDSTDGTRDYLAQQPDVSLWSSTHGYKQSRFGMDWIMHLLRRHGQGNWCLTVDVDEFLVYPYCETRPLRALTDWLDSAGTRSFSSMLLDMYPKGAMHEHPYREGQNPFEIAQYFDSGNYSIRRNWPYLNLWVQGGPRARLFFADAPKQAPAMNKIPLVKWDRSYAYVSSTHMMLPRGLNLTYEDQGGEKPSGCLLHAKFLDTFAAKAEEELARGQHYAESHEYRAYREGLSNERDLWCNWSEKYINWRQLEILGLMSKGNWA
jgi:Glycosyl transferase family 2